MFLLILNIIVLIIWISAVVAFPDSKATCDFNCKKCPFPECSERDKAWLRSRQQ